MSEQMAKTGVRPRDAASLILLRDGKDGIEVLIGRRGRGARFMPGRYVFPGGRVVPEDARPWAEELADRGTPGFLALKRAALRETFEETGLVIGEPRHAAHGHDTALSPVEAAYRARGIAPAPSRLSLVGRAITPTASPIRFHARFFVADGRLAAGELRPCEELEELHWHPVEREPPGAMQNVTRFMLRCAVEAWRGGAPETPPLYWHRGQRALVRQGALAR
ncbi:MAG TPA: NUDIX domain-containing protein [Stellaceae bacterium]|nr:NUDIX domain-containing protein [Stellaceae bacterium]